MLFGKVPDSIAAARAKRYAVSYREAEISLCQKRLLCIQEPQPPRLLVPTGSRRWSCGGSQRPLRCQLLKEKGGIYEVVPCILYSRTAHYEFDLLFPPNSLMMERAAIGEADVDVSWIRSNATE